MKKIKIAAVSTMVLAMPFVAQAADAPTPLTVNVGTDTSLSLSGLFAAGLKSTSVTDTARAVQTQTRVDDNTSRFTVSGVSNFGDGLKGIFRVESRFTADVRPGTPLVPGTTTNVAAGSGWADGDTWVGLASSDWGQVTVGKSTLYYTDTLDISYLGLPGAGESYRIWDVNGLATFNLLSQVANNIGPIATLGNTRSQNVIRYDSPKLGKADLSVAYSPNPSGDETHLNSCSVTTPCLGGSYASGGTFYGRARYNDGPLSASFSALNQKIQGGLYAAATYNGPLDTTAYRFGVGYTLPMGLRLGLVYDNTSVANGIAGTNLSATRDVVSVPISYEWGKNKAYFTYTVAGATTNIDASGATQLNLGYDYAISKTTFIGAFYTRLKNDTNGRYSPFLAGTSFGGDALLKGEGAQQFSVDINYWF